VLTKVLLMKRDWKMKKMKVLWQVQSLDSTKPTSSRLNNSSLDKNNAKMDSNKL